MVLNKKILSFFIMVLLVVSVFSANYSGFELVSQKFVPEAEATAMTFKHTATGAKLIYMQNDDPEKTFSISFRTPAEDNTGVNHIIEHTVFCGSRKYPVRDAFFEIGKQSLNTFLNAETGADYTSYPIATKNDKDFFNLMDVYLDCVLYTNITKNTYSLRQEGWRYDLKDPKAELKINGVVYNEMKGGYSDPLAVLDHEIKKSLYPETTYQYESGGHPDFVPALTYEHFTETYKKNYVLSNSLIYLYGKMDIEKVLNHIEENYLKGLPNTKIDSKVKYQTPFKKRKLVVGQYSVSPDADTKNQTYLSLNYVAGKASDVETTIGLGILVSLLMDSPASPLMNALIDSGLGVNAYGWSDTAKLQPNLQFVVEGSEEKLKDKFDKVFTDTLKNIVKKGFDKKLVEATFNSIEYGMRTKKNEAQKGLTLQSQILNGWLYDLDPMAYVETDSVIKKLRKQSNEKYFEKLIEKYILNNTHSSMVILKPVKGLDDKKAEALKQKLAKYKAGLKKADIDKLVADTKDFAKWQTTPLTKEAAASIPSLELSDISTKVEVINRTVEEKSGIKILHNNTPTNGISYIHMYFDVTKVPQEKVKYLAILNSLFGQINTSKYGYEELSKLIGSQIGSVDFNLSTYIDPKKPETYTPKLEVSVSVLMENQAKALEIVEEMINRTKFNDKNLIKDTLTQELSNLENDIVSEVRNYVGIKMKAYTTEAGKFEEEVSGITYYEFLKNLMKGYDKNYKDLAKNLEEVMKLVFNKENLVVSFTGKDNEYADFLKVFEKFEAKLNNAKTKNYQYSFKLSSKNEGLIIPGNVQSVGMCGNFIKEGYVYDGRTNVIKNILDSEYIWKNVREKGGAYGGGMRLRKTGMLFFLSWEDPNLKETLKIFQQVGEYLKNFDADETAMKNYIIGAFGNLDYEGGLADRISTVDSMYLTNVTAEDLQNEREETLKTTAQDVRNYAALFEKVLKQNLFIVIGNEKKIKEAKTVFDTVRTIIN